MLRDGTTVHVRPTTPEDEPRLRAFLTSLSEESRWFRYFSGGVDLDWAARNAAAPADGLSLLALRGPEGTVVGHGTYIAGSSGRAEIAFAVADAWHGHGIATVLLAHLAQSASSEGIGTFTATVLASNYRMLQVFHDSGFLVSARHSANAIEIEFPTSLSGDARTPPRGAPARRRRRGGSSKTSRCTAWTNPKKSVASSPFCPRRLRLHHRPNLGRQRRTRHVIGRGRRGSSPGRRVSSGRHNSVGGDYLVTGCCCEQGLT